MKRSIRLILTTMAFACAAGAVRASDLKAPPQWPSDRIRAIRPVGPQNAIVFQITRTQGGGNNAGVKTQSVVLAPDFTEVTDGADHRLYDHALCRDLSWSNTSKSMGNTSCYAGPAYRVYEMANRLQLGRALSADGKAVSKTGAADAPYWAEAELGVQLTPSAPLVRQTQGAEEVYRLGSDTVVRQSGVSATLSAEEAHALVRYLALETSLHPQVRQDIGKSRTLFQKLEIDEAGGRRTTLVVSGFARQARAYPLPEGLPSSLELAMRDAQGVRDEGVAEALRVANGVSTTAKPTLTQLLNEIDQADAAKQSMRVLFLFFELSQQYAKAITQPANQAGLNRVRSAVQAALADPAVARMYRASDIAGRQGGSDDRQAAARELASERLDGIPFSTFRNVAFANLVRGSEDVSKWDPAILASMPTPLTDNYWVHIKAYPWAGNAYADAGGAYLATYDVVNAWLSFDLGRAIDRDWRSGVMAGISDFEDRLRQEQPDFF